MSKMRVLTWHKNHDRPGGRWRKYIDNKVWYFGHGQSEDDSRSYRQAEKKYFEFIQKREVTKPVEIQLQDAAVSDIVEKYLQQLADRYNRGDASPSYLDSCRVHLQDFTDFIGPEKKFRLILELALEDYKNHVLNLPVSKRTERRISPATAQHRLQSVQMLYRWSYRMFLLERLPRNVEGLSRLPPNAIKPRLITFTLDELKLLFANATPLLRCYMALALNCGMGQRDVAELRVNEVDWENGIIDRERWKSKVRAKHKLWPMTLDLLKQFRCPTAHGDDRVLLNDDGLPLSRHRIEDGKYKRCDCIKLRFGRLLRLVGLDGKRSFYCLRKTGATLVEAIDPAATEMYLAHSEKGMKRAYAERDWGRLERALVEMKKVIGLEK